MADPKIKYDIEAAVTGEANVEQLEQTLRDLGTVLDGDLKKKALGAADALKALTDKQQAVTAFKELRSETQQLGQALNTASGSVDRVGQAYQQAQTATQGYAQTEAKARAAVDATKAELTEMRAALASLRTEYTGADRNTDQYRESNAQLRVTIADLRTTLKERRDELTNSVGVTKAAQQAERALGSEYEREQASARKLSADLGDKNRALEASRATLQSVGIATTGLADTEKRLQAAVAGVTNEVKELAPAYSKAAAVAATSGSAQLANAKKVEGGIAGIGQQLRTIQGLAASALGGSLLVSTIKDVAQTADEYKNLAARLKLVTGEGKNFEAALAGVQQIAMRTNSDLDSTATLFARITQAGKDAGLGAKDATQQALGLTETINQSIQLSGASAEASKAAIVQLVQGLQSGVLRGDEFNSVMEQSPRLARALADGLGKTTGELRNFAQTGQLTTKTVIAALQGQADAINGEFASLPQTVGRALQNLSTGWTVYVGESGKGAAASKAAADAINYLATNLNTIVPLLLDVGKAGAAFAALRLAQTFLGIGAAASTAATQVVAANTAMSASNVAATALSGTAGRLAGIFAGLRSFTLVGLLVNAPEIGKFLGETVAKMQGYGDAIKRAEENLKLQELAEKDAADSRRRQAAEMERLELAQFELSKTATNLIAKYDGLVKSGDNAAEAIGKIGKDFDLSTAPGIKDAVGVLDRLAASGKLSAEEIRAAFAQALNGKDLAVFEVQATAAFDSTQRGAERLALVFDGTLREAVRRTGLDFTTLQGGIGTAARSAINDVESIVQGLGKLSAQGVDTGRVLATSIGKAIDTADSQKAIDVLKLRIEELRSSLGNKLADGLLDQAKDKARELSEALDKALPGIQSVEEAMRQLGVTTDASLKDAAAKSKESFDFIAQSGKASAREIGDAFKASAEKAIAANKGVAPSWVEAQAAARGYEVAVDSAGKTSLRSLGDTDKAVQSLGDGLRDNTQALKEQADAWDKLAIKQKLSADYTERQISLQEKQNELAERAATLERKRLGVDKEGFSTDKSGNRLVAGTDLGTRTGIAAFLKSAGVDDETVARRIASEFADSYGNVQYSNKPGQIKYGGKNGTLSEAVLKAAEQYTFNPANNATSKIPPQASRTINVNLPNGSNERINVSDDASADALERVINQIAASRRSSGK